MVDWHVFTDGVLLTCPTFYPPLVNGWKSLLVQLRFIIDGTSSCYRRRKANRISHWNHKILLWSNLFEENSSNNLLAYPHDLEQTVERKQCSYWRLTDSLLQSAIYTIVVQCVRVMLLVSLWLPWGSLQPPGLLHLDSSVIFVNWSLLGIVKVLLNHSFVHDFHCIPQTQDSTLWAFPTWWTSTTLLRKSPLFEPQRTSTSCQDIDTEDSDFLYLSSLR